MLEINFKPFPVLTTERLVLRKKTKDDVHELFFLRSDEHVMKYLDRPKARSIEDAAGFIDMINNALENNEGITWGISLKDDPKLIGNIGFWRIEKGNYRAEIGYALHPAYHKKGIMYEAMKAVLNYGFNVIGLHSVEANINPANTASAKLLEKTGFIKEAHFRQNYFFEGKFLDSVIYSLIAPPKTTSGKG
jgi:ribosomal-protein-alanine N-acetyltransferase